MRSQAERLRDMLDAIEAIDRYTSAGRERFDRDELVRSWVVRHLAVIGEAAGRLSDELRGRAPEIPWGVVIGARNVLVHAYFDIDHDEVWNTVQRDLPPLRVAVERLLAALGEPGEP